LKKGLDIGCFFNVKEQDIMVSAKKSKSIPKTTTPEGTRSAGKTTKTKTITSKTSRNHSEDDSTPKGIREAGTVFVLKNIQAIQVILSHYIRPSKTNVDDHHVNDDNGDLPQTIIPETGEEKPQPSVSELMHEKSKKAIYFLDSHKKQVKHWVNMIDYTTNGALPQYTTKPCWWCRHTFQTRPIGCPLRYHEHKTSGVDKERFEEKLKSANLPTDTNDFFETEGIFCSFPCTKAYILSMKHIAKYKESSTSLTLLYSILFGKVINIPRAPSWKILKDYMGHLTIQEFRATFGQLVYDETVNIRRPYMFSSSRYISEKKVKLFRDP
jgi:hypothetical protein